MKPTTAILATGLLTVLAFTNESLAVCGDLNTNDGIEATDASICLQGAVGAISLDGRCTPADNCGPVFPPCGDVNGDDANSSTDCLMILNAAIAIIDIQSNCDCEGAELCGNGVVDDSEGEECDDGNIDDGDGCSATCETEAGADPCEGVEPANGTDITAELVASGLPEIVFVTGATDGSDRLFVVLKEGLVRVVSGGAVQPGNYLDIRDNITIFDEENGLLGMALHPDFANNGRFFVNYTDNSSATVISRFEEDPQTGSVDSLDETILLQVFQDDVYHNGGHLAFGPDGYLYIGLGDGNGDIGGDPANNAQNGGTLLGKMLRVDVNVDTPPYYAVPPDNPNPAGFGQTGLIWANGLRNPWRYSFDRETGDLLIADVGQSAVEEINFQPAASTGGENYGWNCYEGSSEFGPPICGGPLVFPIHEYPHSGSGEKGCSITGGYVYRGCAMPDLHGTYFYADYCQNTVRTFEVVGGAATNLQDRTSDVKSGGANIRRIASFGEDAQGELYIVNHNNGELYKIVPD